MEAIDDGVSSVARPSGVGFALQPRRAAMVMQRMKTTSAVRAILDDH
jgi:hypothetical protein